MALFPCIECGNMVSTRADFCPKCGCPNDEPWVYKCFYCGKTFRLPHEPREKELCLKCRRDPEID